MVEPDRYVLADIMARFIVGTRIAAGADDGSAALSYFQQLF